MDNLTTRATQVARPLTEQEWQQAQQIVVNALSETDLTCRESMIIEYLQRKMSNKKIADSAYSDRLDQARDNIIQFNNQIVIALLHGEPETSDYIQNRSDRIVALIEQVEQLESLVGTKSIAA